MMVRSLGVHVGLLVVASALGARAWLAEDEDRKSESSVDVWSGEAAAVSKVAFSSASAKLLLEAKSDAAGRYFVGDLEREKKQHNANPHAPKDAEATGTLEREQVRFISVEDATELAEQLAPLTATRSLGILPADKLGDFGFSEEEPATLTVVVGGQQHELIIGDKTPGGSDLYAKTKDGEAFVIDGQIARDLEAAEARLMERDYKSWEQEDAVAAKITTEAGSRELKLGQDQKSWGDAQSPEEKDETATNWMDKLQRLRLIEYADPAPDDLRPLFSAEFFDAEGKRLGSVQLAARPSPEGDKEEYFARSEHTRWWGKVLSSAAEQLSQDVSGVIQE